MCKAVYNIFRFGREVKGLKIEQEGSKNTPGPGQYIPISNNSPSKKKQSSYT